MKTCNLNQINTLKFKTISLTFKLFTSKVNLTKISFILAITWLSINPEFLQAQPRPWMPPGIEMVAKAKGRTHGHIAELSISNTTGQTITIEIPPVRIPNTAPNPATGRAAQQGFIIPEPTNVDVPPNATVETPLHGYCTDPDLPPPAVGSDLPPVDTWDPDAPLIQQAQDIIRTVSELQNNGNIQTPFSGNPLREREAVIQQTLWWWSAGSAYDPCEHIRQSISESVRDTDWYSATQPPKPTGQIPQPVVQDYFSVIDQGIAQIIDAMIRVSHELGHPDVSVPSLPTNTPPITPATSPIYEDLFNAARVKGTGRTTGHIADFVISNPTDTPITVIIGDGPIFIPSAGREQSYVAPPIPPMHIEPGQTVTVAIEGYCADVRKPPVGAGENLPPISEWIGANPADRQTPPITRSPDEPPREIVTIPLQTAPPLSTVNDILENIPSPSFPANWNCPDLPAGTNVLIPGTDTPLRIPLSSSENPELAVPVIIEALDRIIKATDDLIADGAISTPFSNSPPKEREAVIQQTFWMFTSALEGNPYVKEDFSKKTTEQFETSTGRPVSSIPQTQKEQLDKGVDDFWNTFQAVGAEAKVLPQVPVTPVSPLPEDIFNSTYNNKVYWEIPQGSITYETDRPPGISFQSRRPPPEEKEKEKCDCNNNYVEFRFKINNEEVHFTSRTNNPVKSHELKTKVKNNDELKFNLSNLKAYCSPCNGRSCEPTPVSHTITSPQFISNSYKISPSDGNDPVEVNITLNWHCEKGRDCDPSNACTENFTCIIPRVEACDCDDFTVSGILAIKTNDQEEKTEDVVIEHGKPTVSKIKAKKDDVIQIKMMEVVPVCKDCKSGACKPEKINILMFPSNLSGYSSSQIKHGVSRTNSRRGFDLLKSNAKALGNGDVTIKLDVGNKCASRECEAVDCNRSFEIKIPVEE